MPILGTDNAKRPVMSDPRCGMRMMGLGLRGHGPCPDGHGDLETELCLSSHKTFVSTMWQNSHSLGKPFVNVLLLRVQGAGPGPDSHVYPVSTKNNSFHHPQQLLFQQHFQKVITCDSPWSGPRPCSPRWLDLTQMVMDIRQRT